jgi:hypothetical protein
MVCLWKKAVRLMDLLSQIEGLPHLEIHPTDQKASEWSEESKWSTDGIAQKTIPVDRNYEYYDEYNKDFEAILEPF